MDVMAPIDPCTVSYRSAPVARESYVTDLKMYSSDVRDANQLWALIWPG